jgi:glycosyltransferase involved in cell wall biosynthesis
MKIKILHISHTDIRFDSRILKEMKSLSLVLNYEMFGFGIKDRQSLKYSSKFDSNIRTFILRTKSLVFLPKSIRYFLNYFEAMVRILFSAIRLRPKVVHSHDTIFLPVAVLIKIFCKSRLIYDAHELESQKNGQSKLLSKGTLIIEKICWRFVDVLITVSPSITKWYNENLGVKNNVLVLNSPQFNSDTFEETSNNYLREKFNIPDKEKIFLYLGIIGRGRGVDLYLDIFQSSEINSHIVFIGFGDYVPKVEQISRESEKIHYHPAVPHEDVVKISKSADVGLSMIEAVSLSDYYCLPNKLFEYAFSGLFVLATDFPDMKKVVEEYSLGLCCSLNKEDLKSTVKKIEDMELSKISADLYPLSWQYQGEKLIKAYNELLINKN